MAGLALRAIHRLVDREVAAGVSARSMSRMRSSRSSAVATRDQTGGRDRAGVDHRVERPARVRIEADRVERVARRLHADLLSTASRRVLEREAVHVTASRSDWIVKLLRCRRPRRRGRPAVASAMPNQLGIGPWQLRDVGGDFTSREGRRQVAEDGLDGRNDG